MVDYHISKLREMVKLSSGEKRKTNQDQMLVRDAVVAAVVSSPNSYRNGSAPSMSQSLFFLGLQDQKNYRNLVKRAINTRGRMKAARAVNSNPKWLSILRRCWKGHRRVTDEVKQKVIGWIKSNEHVVESPIFGDTIFKKYPNGEKQRVPKLLLEVPVRELHNDLVGDGGLEEAIDAATGTPINSDTALRLIIKKEIPELRRMSTRHKIMRGCEICIIVRSHQKTLNAWRRRKIRMIRSLTGEERSPLQQEYIGEMSIQTEDGTIRLLHEEPRDALSAIQYGEVEGCGLPHWNCVLRICGECPKYKMLALESQEYSIEEINFTTTLLLPSAPSTEHSPKEHQNGISVVKLWTQTTRAKCAHENSLLC
jgi:hypothetical protein